MHISSISVSGGEQESLFWDTCDLPSGVSGYSIERAAGVAKIGRYRIGVWLGYRVCYCVCVFMN